MSKLSYSERTELNKQLQQALADANEALERAKQAANTLESPFSFLGRVYEPVKVVTTGGHFDHEPAPTTEGWEQSDDYDWQASSC